MANYDSCNISLKYRAILDIPMTFTAVYQSPEFGHRLIYIRDPSALQALVVPCMVHNNAFWFRWFENVFGAYRERRYLNFFSILTINHFWQLLNIHPQVKRLLKKRLELFDDSFQQI